LERGRRAWPEVLLPRRDTIVAGLWVDDLTRFAAGEPLREVVNRARGY